MKLKLRTILEKPERIFIIIGSFFGLISLFMLPVLTAPDEGAHFWMSYGMFSKNQQIPNDLLVSAEDSVKYIKDDTYTKKIFQDKADLEGDTLQFNYTKEITINSTNDSRSVSTIDISRLPQAIGVTIGRLAYPSIGVMTTLGRLFNLVVFLLAIYAIIKRVKYGKLALAFLALFPMMIHQATSLSYDVVNIVIVFAWVALMINLSVQRTTITRKQIIKIALLGAIIAITKPTNMLLFGLLPFISSDSYKNTRIFVYIKNRIPKITVTKRTLWTLACLLAAVCIYAGIRLLDAYLDQRHIGVATFATVLFNTFFRTDINPQLDPIVTTGIVGHFGWLWYKLPEWLVLAHLSVFGLILMGERAPRVSRQFAVVSGLLFISSLLVITIGMYFMWTLTPCVAGVNATFIQGMQGRYFTPLLVLLIPLFAYLQQYISVRINRRLLYAIAVTAAMFSLAVYLILTYTFFY